MTNPRKNLGIPVNKIINPISTKKIDIDEDKNSINGNDSNGIITKNDTPIAMVVPTNEELVIAMDTYRCVKDAAK